MYDIIGDIHGHADELERLLRKMGYRKKGGIYSHPENRTAVFVGDFIDRGSKIRETLHLVRDMCDAGHAKAVMGNHEFNALCYHTPDTENGGYFREHSPKNLNQHGRRETWGDVLMGCPDEITGDKLNLHNDFHTYDDEKPVFFGHYWLRGEPGLNHSKAVCLDYSVAKGGKLVAYRWDGAKLAEGRFVY